MPAKSHKRPEAGIFCPQAAGGQCGKPGKNNY
nr:MAG TPA: hypothetical protein [Caudoviricetes sp.]